MNHSGGATNENETLLTQKEKKLRTKKSMQPSQQLPAPKNAPSFINDSFFTESFFHVLNKVNEKS